MISQDFFHFMHCPGPYHRYLMKMQQYKIWMLLQKRIHLIVTSQMQQSVLTILVHSWKQKNNWYLIWENEILCQIVPNRAGTVKMIQKSASKNFLDPIQNCALSIGPCSLRSCISRPYCKKFTYVLCTIYCLPMYLLCLIFLDIPTYPKIGHPLLTNSLTTKTFHCI